MDTLLVKVKMDKGIKRDKELSCKIRMEQRQIMNRFKCKPVFYIFQIKTNKHNFRSISITFATYSYL